MAKKRKIVPSTRGHMDSPLPSGLCMNVGCSARGSSKFRHKPLSISCTISVRRSNMLLDKMSAIATLSAS